MRRTLWPVVIVTIAAAVAGCGSGSSGGSSTATASATSGSRAATTTRAKAVKFAECMRAKGVDGFPDPDASGQLTIDAVANGSSVDTSSGAFEQALRACKELEPPGFTGPKVTSQLRTARLKFARCIRDNGVPDFPDPGPSTPLIDTNRIPSANTSAGMSALHAAMYKCRDFAAAAGVTGGR